MARQGAGGQIYRPLMLMLSQRRRIFLMKRLDRWLMRLLTRLKREKSSTLVAFLAISGSHTLPQIMARSISSMRLMSGFSLKLKLVMTLKASTRSLRLLFLAESRSVCSTLMLLSSIIMLLQWYISASEFSMFTSMLLTYQTLIRLRFDMYSMWNKFWLVLPSSLDTTVVVLPSASYSSIFQLNYLIFFSSTRIFQVYTRSPCLQTWLVPNLGPLLSFVLSLLFVFEVIDMSISIRFMETRNLMKSSMPFSSAQQSREFCWSMQLNLSLRMSSFRFIYCTSCSNLPVLRRVSYKEQFNVFSRQLQVRKTSVSSRQLIRALGLRPFCKIEKRSPTVLSKLSSCLMQFRSTTIFLSFSFLRQFFIASRQFRMNVRTFSAYAFSYLKGFTYLKLASMYLRFSWSKVLNSCSSRNSVMTSMVVSFLQTVKSSRLRYTATFLMQQVQSKQALWTIRLKKVLGSMLGVSGLKAGYTRPCWCRTMLLQNSVFSWMRMQCSAMSRVTTSSGLISQAGSDSCMLLFIIRAGACLIIEYQNVPASLRFYWRVDLSKAVPGRALGPQINRLQK